MPPSDTTRHLWKPLVVAAAVAFVYWGVVVRLARFWWEDENYSHGLLIPFVIGYILWTERGRLARAAGRGRVWLGGAAVAAALLALWAGTAGAELFVQRASLVLLLAGVAVFFWGLRLLRAVAVPLLLLGLAIPIPTIVFNKVAFPLQLFASRCAVWAMRAFDIPVLREGNVIELLPLGSATTRKLEVVEACSGIRSLMTLVTLAVVYAYFTHPEGGDGGGRRSRFGVLRAVLIVLAAVPIAIITNAARVSGTGLLSHYYGTEVADGFFHSFSGWVVYVVAFLLLFAFGWLIDRFDPGRHDPGAGGDGAARVSEAVALSPPDAEGVIAAGGAAQVSMRRE
ncbi:MAG TPA: exosortase/archaeosortase family protein [Pyrinomonadaceae bacterium]|nr:exosortase/archaeosortase family protein [Pyrinomonadaceae bacterium]